ncbi:hypothetical protein [Alteromonas sp. ASW11-130]|uniref:hypothetical protein n=1 Tax=Alteromonas sp. ASW11-130 TaxID=3015775 RepID=UPI00224228C9|nr:hypothetical protein [Alteromonas sp. ASW11-130]MCW8091879.1 hypothetical protein [Alteromonas sp. ASW11-130]
MNTNLWVKITNNLAITYAFNAEVDENADVPEVSIDTFTQAKDAYEDILADIEAAAIGGNLGKLHCKLATLRDNREILAQSLTYLDRAIAVFHKHAAKEYISHFASMKRPILASHDSTRIKECECSA